MIFQFTGLSGAGKTTLANLAKKELVKFGFSVEIIDGDEVRKLRSKALGFSKSDRIDNILRIAEIAIMCQADIIIISVMNPFNETRDYLKRALKAKLIWIDCDIEELKSRDTKGLYRKALLIDEHPDKLFNLTGINAPFEIPENTDCFINTSEDSVEISLAKLIKYILGTLV